MAPKKPIPDEKAHKEKKDGFLETAGQGKSAKDGQKVPMYLVAVLVVAALLAGVALTITFFMPNSQGGNGNNGGQDSNADLAYRSVPVTIVYSKDCKSCRQTTTIEELFKVRGITYTIRKVEAGSEEGRKIASNVSLARVPAAIVDADKIAFYPKTKSDFDAEVAKGNFGKIGSFYAIPEQNWNADYYYPIYYLEPQAGFCTAGKPSVTQFDDYYTPDFSYGRGMLYKFIADFNTTADIRFSYAQTRASVDANFISANIFLMCASSQGKYARMERAISGIYCNNPFRGDPTILTEPEINGCWSLSNHYGTALSQQELDISSNRAGLDSNSLKDCYSNQKFVYSQAQKAAADLSISRPGTFLIDCRETTNLAHLKESFCAIHPELEACNAKAENSGSG